MDEVLTIGRHDIETAALGRLAKLSDEHAVTDVPHDSADDEVRTFASVCGERGTPPSGSIPAGTTI